MKKKLLGLLIIFIIILFNSGIGEAFNSVKILFDGILQVFGFIIKLAIQFPSELGITDSILTRTIYMLLTIIFSGVGVYLNKKQSKKLLSIISFAISIISFILTISSFN